MSAENTASSCDGKEKFGTLFKRPRIPNSKYADLNFSLLKKGYKYSAFCHVCKKSIKNTATVRLQTHRKVCQPCTPYKRNEKLVRKTTTRDSQKLQEKTTLSPYDIRIQIKNAASNNLSQYNPMVILGNSLQHHQHLESNLPSSSSSPIQFSESIIQHSNSQQHLIPPFIKDEPEVECYENGEAEDNNRNCFSDSEANHLDNDDSTDNSELYDSEKLIKAFSPDITITTTAQTSQHRFINAIKSSIKEQTTQTTNQTTESTDNIFLDSLHKFTESLDNYTETCKLRNELEKYKIEIEKRKLEIAEHKLELKRLKYQSLYNRQH